MTQAHAILPIEHYENFPVASILLPKRLRYPVSVIYRFARTADDFADEGNASPAERLAQLETYKQQLDTIVRGQMPSMPLFVRLRQVIIDFQLPLSLFYDLLDAFSQDVVKTRYASYAEILDYCRRSANPIGRLMLGLFGAVTPENLRDSDRICTSLQLINFWQDVAIDWQKQRVYLPKEDLEHFGIDDNDMDLQMAGAKWQALMQCQVRRARAMMLAGAPLGQRLTGRIGLEIRTVIQGGLFILDKIEAVEMDVFRRRPQVGKLDYLRLLWAARK